MLAKVRRRQFVELTAAAALFTPALAAAAPNAQQAAEPRPTPLQRRAAKRRREHPGFTVVIEEPFVVMGDEDEATVHRRCTSTIRWATDRLRAAYFSRDPKALTDVWLFKDDRSYRQHAKRLFNDDPDTPYGYYSPHHHALVMNISTGGGTLVHEMVHPFIDADFPTCPSWFDEGLASLYEQCGDRNGTIWGFTNWRLPGLQTALRGDAVPSFRELTATSRHEFYNEDPGTNYAQARYLCFYLQQRGLLRRFYRAFRRNAERDPTGYAVLQATVGYDDMNAFERDWSRFVAKLRYR